ncbi:NADP-dependent oxidoreductase [Nocardia macrotermitis]|uniref:2-haloacrylate reductase n=1 Tax=Nocardia macrotermitis TaxID=2585198 RepID=A0A7K0D6U4_9NOCA|nr:NADP-dependent oxidoreductase [Nocardia macrotermitis]MQY21438.1 2-haloacrylate reductase [Nocardia macrotermitis]
MKAVSQQILGGPEVLETVEVPLPTLRPGQVLIRLAATSVNPVDCKLRAGQVGFLGEPPFTLGFDLSGTVTEVGEGVSEFRSGDQVFGMVHTRTGTYSEYVTARADSLARCPAGLDLQTAAALPTAALTAWQALELAELRSGERILIHAAAGGVGHLAVQFAKLRGARVIGTARTANHEFLRDLGADELIDYTTTDFTTAIDEVDVVLDLVGGDYGSRSLRVLTPDGRYITAQQSNTGDDSRAALITGRPSPADLSTIGKLAESGQVRVHIDRVLSLAAAAEAHRLSESGRVRGKLVLTPW